MDAVVVEENRTTFAFQLLPVKNPIRSDHARVHRDAVVGHTDLEKPQDGWKPGAQQLVKRDAGFPGGGLVLVAGFEWCGVQRRSVRMFQIR